MNWDAIGPIADTVRTAAFAGVMVLTLTAGTLSAQQPVLIEATTVVSPHLDAPISGVSVLIEDGRIQAIEPVDELSPPPGVRRIDGRGKWVIPGIVEYHSHQTGPDPLRRALALGVTTAQTVSRPEQPNEMEARSNDPDHPSPRLHLLSGHVGSWRGPRPETPETVEEARAEILRMRAEGVKAIKIWHDDGTLWLSPDQTSDPIPRDVFVTLVRTAHEQGMEVAVHAWRLPFLRQAIDAGVDRLIHPVADSIVPASVWERLRGDQLAWASTMTVLLAWADIPEYARRVLSDRRLAGVLSPARRDALERARTASEFSRYAVAPRMRANRDLYMQIVQRNTLLARANGVSIVVGCDAPIGFGTHIEMELLAEIGLTPAEILSAATINGARALGVDDRFGTVEVGKTADLVLLSSNPLEDTRNLRVFEPGELVAESNR